MLLSPYSVQYTPESVIDHGTLCTNDYIPALCCIAEYHTTTRPSLSVLYSRIDVICIQIIMNEPSGDTLLAGADACRHCYLSGRVFATSLMHPEVRYIRTTPSQDGFTQL